MGEYSVIGITPDCKSGALCGCRFKSYLAHQSSDTEEILVQIADDKASVWTVLITSLLEFAEGCQL